MDQLEVKEKKTRGRKKKEEKSVDIKALQVIQEPTPVPEVQEVQPIDPPKAKREFKYTRLSASMAKTFLLCKRKFYQHYVLGIQEAPNQSFTLGTAAHKALEAANESLMTNPRELNPFEVESFIQLFRDSAAAAFVKDYEIFSEGESFIREELNAYNLNEKILGVEQEFDLVTPEGVRIYGFIDKITEVNANTIKVIDYKTSKNPMSYEEGRTDLQLSMYDLAVSMLYPDYPNRILELRYLRPQDSLKSYRTEIEQHNFRRELLSIDRAIKTFLASHTESPKGDLNDLCNWCGFKNQCPEFVETANTLLPDAPSTFNLTEAEFVDLYQRVSSIHRSSEKWMDALKIWVAQKLEEDPGTVITNGEKLVYTMSTTRREYNVAKLGKFIGIDDLLGASTGGVPLVNLVNKRLDEYIKIKGNKKLNEKAEELVEIKFNSPQIRLKKTK